MDTTSPHAVTNHYHACKGHVNHFSVCKGSPASVRRSFWNTKCSCIFSCLPDEIMILNIFSILGREDICKLARVCTRWKFMSQDRFLWRQLDASPHALQVNDFTMGQLLTKHGNNLDTLKLCGANLLSPMFLHAFSSTVPKLREVHLCKSKHVNADMVTTMVKVCPRLTSISLFGCPLITDSAVQNIGAHLPRLRELSVRGCKQLTDDSLTTLGPMLESLNVGGCSRMSGEGTASILAARCNNLRRLNLHGINLTDAALASLVRGCPSLQNLQVSSSNPFGGTSNIGDAGMSALANLPNLKSLNLQGSSQISDQGLKALARGCKGLECLNLGGVYRITDEGVAEITKNMPALTMVSLFQCFNLSDFSVARLAQLPSLEQLDLHSCVGLIKALDILRVSAPGLQVLDLGSCRNIPPEDGELFKQERADVKLTFY